MEGMHQCWEVLTCFLRIVDFDFVGFLCGNWVDFLIFFDNLVLEITDLVLNILNIYYNPILKVLDFDSFENS
jgi:hypothetical protein